MKAFKLVARVRYMLAPVLGGKSYYRDSTEQKFYSAFSTGDYCLTYIIGQLTKPSEGKIFLFDTLSNVDKFVHDPTRGFFRLGEFHDEYAVLEGEAIDTQKASNLDTPFRECDYTMFWNGKFNPPHDNKCTQPLGTIFCNGFTPIKMLDKSTIKDEKPQKNTTVITP